MSSCSLFLFSGTSIWTPFFVKLFFVSLLRHVVHLDPLLCQVVVWLSSLSCPFQPPSLSRCSLTLFSVMSSIWTPSLSSCALTLFSVMSSIWTLFFVKLFFDSLLRHVVQLDPLLFQVVLALSSPSCRPFGPPSLSSCSLTLILVMSSIWTPFFVKLFFDSLLCHVVHLDPLLCQVTLNGLSSLSCPFGPPVLSSCSLTIFSVMSSFWTPFFVELFFDSLLCHVVLFDPLLCQVVL